MPVAPGASKEQRNGGLPVPRSYIVDQISYQRMNASCPDGKSFAIPRMGLKFCLASRARRQRPLAERGRRCGLDAAKMATMLQPSPGLGGSQTEAVAKIYQDMDELPLARWCFVHWCYWLLQQHKHSGPAFPRRFVGA